MRIWANLYSWALVSLSIIMDIELPFSVTLCSNTFAEGNERDTDDILKCINVERVISISWDTELLYDNSRHTYMLNWV